MRSNNGRLIYLAAQRRKERSHMDQSQIPNGAEKVGEISAEVKIVLGLDIAVGTPIYIGPTNVEHMEREHP